MMPAPKNMNELSDAITAYPYLKIARKYAAIGTTLTYRDILCFADAYKKHFRNLNYWEEQAKSRLQKSPIANEIIHIHEVMEEYVGNRR